MHTSKREVRVTAKMNGKCLQVAGSNELCKCQAGTLHVNESTGCANQSFFLEQVSNGIFVIWCKASGKVLDVCHESKKDGASVLEYQVHGRDNQLWIFVRQVKDGVETEYIQIQSVNSGKVLEIQGGLNANGVKVVQNTNYRNENQFWRLLPVSFLPSDRQK